MHKAIFAAAALVFSGSAFGAFIITDPATMNTAAVNGNNETMNQQAGNITLANYNALADKRVFNFDNFTSTGNDGTTQANGGKVKATADNVTATFGVSGLGTFAFITGGADYATSTSGGLEQAIQHNRATFSISFDTPVEAVAFTASRLQAAATVTLTLSDSTTKQYTLNINSPGSTKGQSFFGYSIKNETPASPKIASMTIVTNVQSQYGIDDFSFVKVVPEPTSAAGLIGAGSVMFLRRRR